MIKLNDDIQFLKGVGLQRKKLFERLGINTVFDLLCFFPRDYLDCGKIVSIKDLLPEDSQTIKGTIQRVDHRTLRKRLSLTTLTIHDGTGSLKIPFFNQGFLRKMFKQGQIWIFTGKIKTDFGLQMSPITYEQYHADDSTLPKILPIYPLTEGLNQNQMRKITKDAIQMCSEQCQENLPQSIVSERHLMNRSQSFQMIHHPSDNKLLQTARYRLIYEEFFTLQACLLQKRKRLQTHRDKHFILKKEENFFEIFEKKLSFTLTNSQRKVMSDIEKDFQSSNIMLRLLQGDVGSGKTIVAMYAIFLMVKSGYQVAFMAPTEILSVQHFGVLNDFFGIFDIRCELLLGGTPTKKRRNILDLVHLGDIDVLVGTHALIQGDIVFQELGLVIIDEQHKFGVAQRAQLQDKGSHPHLLVITATPIPRTLSMVVYGDLDVSIIDEMPLNRKKIKTYFIEENRRSDLYSFVKKEIHEQRQAYFVYPLIEKSDIVEWKSVEDFFDILCHDIFEEFHVAMLHGRMKTDEKKDIMETFRQGNIDILVSTTVIEVGLDIPNATVMIIENPSRFGLAQLHQLRGRVGRGSEQSHCFLIEENISSIAKERIKIFCSVHDGFEIAKSDLEIRGPGDFLGSRQSGLPTFRLGDILSDFELMKQVKEDLLKFEHSFDLTHFLAKMSKDQSSLVKNTVLVENSI